MGANSDYDDLVDNEAPDTSVVAEFLRFMRGQLPHRIVSQLDSHHILPTDIRAAFLGSVREEIESCIGKLLSRWRQQQAGSPSVGGRPGRHSTLAPHAVRAQNDVPSPAAIVGRGLPDQSTQDASGQTDTLPGMAEPGGCIVTATSTEDLDSWIDALFEDLQSQSMGDYPQPEFDLPLFPPNDWSGFDPATFHPY